MKGTRHTAPPTRTPGRPPASTSALPLALPLVALWLASTATEARAQPCSALDRSCPPVPCRTANPQCPEGQVCALALDSPPCPTLDAQCPDNGLCITITQDSCDGHEDCQGAEVCYDKGRPLCADGDPPQGPPCETPTTLPQGQCAPATECGEDAHCRSGADGAPDEGFFCDRVRVHLGFTGTDLGVCAPRLMACLRPDDCPDTWTCEATADGLDASAAEEQGSEDQDPEGQTPEGQNPEDRQADAPDAGGQPPEDQRSEDQRPEDQRPEGICVPQDHVLVCGAPEGCLILRRSPALALSSPFAAPSSMTALEIKAGAAAPGEQVAQGGCQAAPGAGALLTPWAALALIGLAATRRRRR